MPIDIQVPLDLLEQRYEIVAQNRLKGDVGLRQLDDRSGLDDHRRGYLAPPSRLTC
jgi:hypothetical protein